MTPLQILKAFDAYLSSQNLTFDGVLIGGAALSILDAISRETQDCDVLAPSIPNNVMAAAIAFSQQVRANGGDLKEDWFNNGPETLCDVLPGGWRLRLRLAYSGKALNLSTLGRQDLLASKLFAYCDRLQDLSDCIALNPAREELVALAPWVTAQDAHPDWPEHASMSLRHLASRLGYDL